MVVLLVSCSCAVRYVHEESLILIFYLILLPFTILITDIVDAKKEKENDATKQEEATAAAAADAKAKADAMARARANAKLGIGSGVVAGGSSAVSANAFASGSNQNSGNVMTGRPTSRVLAPPGGHCSIQLF